ncbi:hypothetical protein EDD21DRAFT_445250 [Dissophora ornata]|nr:hypothetical protein EDD21DRAFT_445250 [Dissophora ornata]
MIYHRTALPLLARYAQAPPPPIRLLPELPLPARYPQAHLRPTRLLPALPLAPTLLPVNALPHPCEAVLTIHRLHLFRVQVQSVEVSETESENEDENKNDKTAWPGVLNHSHWCRHGCYHPPSFSCRL